MLRMHGVLQPAAALRNLSRCDWKEVTVKDTMPVPSIGLSRYITLKLLGLLLHKIPERGSSDTGSVGKWSKKRRP